MKKETSYFLLFLSLNFLVLGLGIYLMDGGPLSEWYLKLNKAPWTPPNPTFGISWSIIMVCYSFYMTLLIKLKKEMSSVLGLYILQWFLNSGWNYIFFNQENVLMGLIVIIILFFIICYFLLNFYKYTKWKTLWIFPYFIWLIVAISLNAYILVYNP